MKNQFQVQNQTKFFLKIEIISTRSFKSKLFIRLGQKNIPYIIIATLTFVLPLGVGAAIYLTEYAADKRLVGMIEYAAETLSGIPSIIYGLTVTVAKECVRQRYRNRYSQRTSVPDL